MKYLITGLALLLIQSATSNGAEPQQNIHPHGHPINFMDFTQNQSVTVDYDKINLMFDHTEVADRKIVVLSIIGAYRKGKSFFLNYCLRFMYANYKSVNFMENPLNNKYDWMGADNEPLVGFSWKAGSSRHTSGVVVWSDVFLHDTGTEKLAIILMDTQGLFDAKTTVAENSRIFALTTLLSSAQIFNLNDVIQENQLEYLEAATDFAKFAVSEYLVDPRSYTKPFQNLMFLMRDWAHKDDYNYGLAGGAQYIADTLHFNENQHPDLQIVRDYIKKTFDSVDCYLLPHPGFHIVGSQTYNGNKAELNDEFRDNLEELIQGILKPKHLKKKRFMGREVTGKTYKNHIISFFGIFQSPNLTDVKTVYETAVEKQMEGIIENCLDFYKAKMKQFEDCTRPDFAQELNINHEITKNITILRFRTERKMGSREYDFIFENELVREIDAYHNMTMQSLLNTLNRVNEVRRQNDELIDRLVIEAERKLNDQQQLIEVHKQNILRENEEKLKRVHNNNHQRAEEKEAEILRITADNERKRIKVEQQHAKIVNDLKEKIFKEAEEKTRQAENQIKNLQKQQELEQKSIETNLQNEIKKQNEKIQREAQERRELMQLEEERREAQNKREAEIRKLEFENQQKQILDDREREQKHQQWRKEEAELEFTRERERKLAKDEELKLKNQEREEKRIAEKKLYEAQIEAYKKQMEPKPTEKPFMKKICHTISLGLFC